MKNIKLFVESLWLALVSKPSIWLNPQMMICAWCKLVLNKRPNATSISHGICWKCYYKVNGGTEFNLKETFLELAIVKAFRKTRVYDEQTHGSELHKALMINGAIAEKARLERRSMNSEEVARLDNVRKVAKESGMSHRFINMAEMEGGKQS
jgi:hypothetical protein